MARPLPLSSVIGFNGTVSGGVLVHQDSLIYALGTCVVLRQKGDDKSQEFLQGHQNKISCLCLSRDGKKLATGQIAFMGFTAEIIIWDVESRQPIHHLALHKVKVQALSFSCDGNFLASVGGQDDAKLVVWNVKTGKAVCGSPTPIDYAHTVKFFNTTEDKLVTAGGMNATIWDFDVSRRLLLPTNANFGKIRRKNSSIVSLGPKLFRNIGPKKRIGNGILYCAATPFGDLLAGGGDGTIMMVQSETLKTICSTKVEGGVTSIAVITESAKGESFEFYAATHLCNMYLVRFDAKRNEMHQQLIHTCHYDRINDIAFPSGYSEVFATCANEDIRLWHLSKGQELLRIKVPNQICHCLAFMPDGKSIISGWSDGKIRAYGPQSGKLLYTIHDAHASVRVWKIGPQSQFMIANMKEHKVQVNSIQVRKNDSECVSSSSDGSCIVWDLTRYSRNNSLFASTFFKAALYHPDESQLLTTGTDRKISYWDAFDCTVIRVIDGSLVAEVTSLDISPDGMAFVSGGADREVKLWNYDEGHCYFTGHGHSEPILKVKISPEQHHVVSVGEEGAVFIWDYKSPISTSTSPVINTSPASLSPEPPHDNYSAAPPTSPSHDSSIH